MSRAHDFHPTRDLALRRFFWGSWRCWPLSDREPSWSHDEKQGPIFKRSVRQHRRSDNSAYPGVGSFLIILQHTLLLDNFPTNFMMAQFSLPIKTKRHSIANLLACTRSDCNARLGAFFFTPAPGIFPRPNDSDTNRHVLLLLPTEDGGGARTRISRIIHFFQCIFSNLGTTFAAPQNR